MKTKIIVLLSVLIFALGMFIACGDPMTSESTGESVSATESTIETGSETGSETDSETGSESTSETESDSESISESTSETHTHAYDEFSAWVQKPTLTENGTAKMKCECNEEKEVSVPELGDAKEWLKGADVADACVGGVVKYTSAKYGEVEVQVAPKHQLGELILAKAATCVAKGNIAYKQCSVCHHYFNDDETAIKDDKFETEIDPNNHAFGELVPAKAATCRAKGNIAYKECSACHNFFHEDGTPVEGNAVEIPVNPDKHTPKAAAKEHEFPATCIVAGSYDNVVRCEDCDTIISSEHIVGELGDHNFVSGACSVCHLAEKYSGAHFVGGNGYVNPFAGILDFDAKGKSDDGCINTASYVTDQYVQFTWVDFTEGKFKLFTSYVKPNEDEEPDWSATTVETITKTMYGYMDKETGALIVNFDDDITESVGDSVYLFVPSANAFAESDFAFSDTKKKILAMSVTAAAGTYSVFVDNGNVFYGVTFADVAGNALVASDLKATAGLTFIVKKGGEDVVAYGVNADGDFVKLGLYYGVYEGDEGEPVLTLNGLGEAKLGEKVGSYAVKGEKVELTFVDGDGLVSEFYNVTFADGKYTAIKPMSEVSFNVGAGHDGMDNVTVNTFTAFKLANYKLADTATHLFKGWKLNGELIATDHIIVEGDTTLEAVWAAKLTVTLEDEKIEGGTETITAGVGDDMLAALPDKSGDDTFDGYYIVVDGEEIKLQQGDNFEDRDDGITITAKYVKFPVEADIGNGNGVEGVDVPKGAVVAEYLAEKLADKLAVKDGYKFDGWYLDADFATELATDAVASESISKVYGKWSFAGNVAFTFDSYTFEYDSVNKYWKSGNKGVNNSTAVFEISVSSGIAEISFDYYCESEAESKWDYMTIWYGPEWKSVKAGGKACDWNWKTLSTVITYDPGDTNQRVRVTYQKDSGGSGGSDTAYIRNFRINGIEIFALAPLNPDMAGSYTATDGTVVKVGAGGGVEVGEELVPYTVVKENVIGVTLAAGYREITLNKADNSCVVAVPQVSVTYNYGGHGENTVITVDKNSAQTVLAETPVTGGFIFRGWYKDAALTEKLEAGSSFTANADITFYAKWDKAITVTFKYEDNGAHADETDTTLYANDTVTVKEVDFEFDGKVFAGWFTKNENGEFDTQITTGTALTDDVVLYVKWIEKSPFAGTYTVVRLSSSGSVTVYNSATTKLVVDYFGNSDIKGYNGFSYGNKVTFAFANGSTTVLEITCVTSYSTSKYYAIYDAATGIIARASSSADLNTSDVFVFIPFDENYKTSDFAAYGFNAGGYRKILSFNDKTAENAARNIYTNANALYVNASFKDFDGNAVAVADIKNALNLFVYNGETLVEEFAKNSSGSFVTAIDEYKGNYEGEDLGGALFFNGAGVAKCGEKVGTYAPQADSENIFDVFFNNKAEYYEVELVVDGEDRFYNATRPTVKITYKYMGHGADTDEFEDVYKNVAHDITKAPTAEGFKFWGWFEDEALTQAAKSSYSLTDNLNLYAKWTEAVTLTFDYNGQGTEAVVVADKYVGDKVSGIPAVAADVKFGEKVFAGWFIKHDDGSFGEEASTSTVLEGDTTYYAKWVDAPQSYGTYKGWNLFGTKSSETENKFSREVLVVNANGTYKYGSKSGTLTDEQAAITDGAMVLDETYYYFNKELGLMWRKFNGGKADGVGTDTDLGVDISKVSSVAYTGRSDVGSSYVAYLVITYKDETTKTAFLYNSIIVANATLEGAEATNITGKDFTVKVNGVTIAKVVGKTVLENDGLAGTYTGDYGEIIVDGYGNVTVGGVAVDYTVIAERTIKFVAANSMKEVIVDLGNGTYAKVLDGYQGTYTLPDNSTITLDGFGGAGDGKTYVVNGTNITIFDGETSTNYGIDVANKQFLGKSKFAGLTFSGSYSESSTSTTPFKIVFDDSPMISGYLSTNGDGLRVKFTAVLTGTTLTLTILPENSVSWDRGSTYKSNDSFDGKVIVMTVDGDTLKVTSTEITWSVYAFKNGSAKCEGFSL